MVSAAHREHWRRRRQAEAASILRAHWPEIGAVWLFGSVLEPSFSLNSDIDLCVEGLPSEALLEAMEVLDEALLAMRNRGSASPSIWCVWKRSHRTGSSGCAIRPGSWCDGPGSF